ncbi:MAG: MAPEG family protein [Sandaracinobacter sp.]
MQITMMSAGILGLLLLFLGIRVVQLRMQTRISLGDGDDPDMVTRVRAHGNAAEWIPIGLFLLFLAEQAQGSHWLVVTGAAFLVAGRLLHPFGLANRSPNAARTLGMVLTWTALGGLAILVFVHGIGFR